MSNLKEMIGKISDSLWRTLRIDASTHAVETIEYSHHEVHAGSFFSVHFIVDLGNGADADVVITTPNTTKWTHLLIAISTELEADFFIYEGTNHDDDGNAITAYNHNRNSATTATSTVQDSPTVNAVGTELYHEHWGSGRDSGGEHRGSDEWVLDQDNDYLIRVTNATANNNYVAIVLKWYEHTDKN